MRKLKLYFLFFVLLFFRGLTAQVQVWDSLALDTMKAVTSLQAAMKQPDKVIKLVLRKQRFKKIPKEIFSFDNLKYLDLGKNAIDSIPTAIGDLQQLQVLILEKNDIICVAPEIGRLKNLRLLNLNQNNLGKNHSGALPATVGDLDSLEVLLLSRNRMEILPKEICRLKKLRVLNANQNELTILPNEIGELENLEYLDLWSNNIGYFPEQLGNLEKLKLMDLRVIMIDDDTQQHLQGLLPATKIQFSPGCHCKTQ